MQFISDNLGKNFSLKKHKILGVVSLSITDRIYDRKNTRSLMLTPRTVLWTFMVEKNMDLFQNFLINVSSNKKLSSNVLLVRLSVLFVF